MRHMRDRRMKHTLKIHTVERMFPSSPGTARRPHNSPGGRGPRHGT